MHCPSQSGTRYQRRIGSRPSCLVEPPRVLRALCQLIPCHLRHGCTVPPASHPAGITSTGAPLMDQIGERSSRARQPRPLEVTPRAGVCVSIRVRSGPGCCILTGAPGIAACAWHRANVPFLVIGYRQERTGLSQRSYWRGPRPIRHGPRVQTHRGEHGRRLRLRSYRG